jgi:hypothetical protein
MSLESDGISPRNGLNNTDIQNYVIITVGIIKPVGASENITFMFLCLIHVPEWVLC